MNKGTQYNDIVKSSAKAKKELKLSLQKYALIKSEDNILVSDIQADPKKQNENILKVCKECVDALQKEKGIGSKRYDKPSVIVVVPGVEHVEKVYKLLLKEFKKFNGKSNN